MSRVTVLPFHDHGTRRGWSQRHAPAALYPGNYTVPIVQEAGWAPGPVWTGAENLAPPTGIQTPDRPTRSQSLYRLCYPAHNITSTSNLKTVHSELECTYQAVIIGGFLAVQIPVCSEIARYPEEQQIVCSSFLNGRRNILQVNTTLLRRINRRYL